MSTNERARSRIVARHGLPGATLPANPNAPPPPRRSWLELALLGQPGATEVESGLLDGLALEFSMRNGFDAARGRMPDQPIGADFFAGGAVRAFLRSATAKLQALQEVQGSTRRVKARQRIGTSLPAAGGSGGTAAAQAAAAAVAGPAAAAAAASSSGDRR